MLAKQIFLILHDPFTGKPEVGRELLKHGVAAAALADLVLARRLVIENDRVIVSRTREPSGDEIGSFVIETIRRQKNTYTVRSWIEALGEILVELVARGLVEETVVRREPGRRRILHRNPDRFPAVDLRQAVSPRLRLARTFWAVGETEAQAIALVAIIDALGVGWLLDSEAEQGNIGTFVMQVAQPLPAELRAFVAGVEGAGAALPPQSSPMTNPRRRRVGR